MPSAPISRRALLLASAAGLACRRPKATGFLGYCFVANQAGRSIGVVDLSRFRLRKQIPLDAAPASVLAHPHPTRPRVFALAPEAGTVYEIDAASLSVSRRVRVGSQAAQMLLSPRHDVLWVLSRDPAALVEIPLDSLRPARRIRLAAPPDSFHLCRESDLAAIASRRDASVVLVSLTRASIDRSIAAAAEPSLVEFRPDGRHLLVGSAPGRSLTIYDVPTGKTVVTLPLPLAPQHFCFDTSEGQLFVSGDGMDAVVIVFPYQTEVDQTILAGHAPGAMAAIGPSPYYMMVANPKSGSVTVLDVDTRNLVAVVEVGQGPRQILITPDANQFALVLNEDSGDLAVIRVASLANAAHVAQPRFATPLFTLIPVGEKPVSAAVLAL